MAIFFYVARPMSALRLAHREAVSPVERIELAVHARAAFITMWALTTATELYVVRGSRTVRARA